MASSNRAQIKGIIQENTLELERFQNEILRPILKTHHDVLLENFNQYLISRKIIFAELNKNQKQKHIESSLTKDLAFKNFQLGMVVGQFTLEEYKIYSKNSREYNKRILNMLKKRIMDTIL